MKNKTWPFGRRQRIGRSRLVPTACVALAAWVAGCFGGGNRSSAQTSSVTASVPAVEIRLRSEPVVPRGVVRLGHVATVLGAAPRLRRELERLAIAPAPAEGRRLVVRREDVRRVIRFGASLRLEDVRFRGPDSVVLVQRLQPPAAAATDGAGRNRKQPPATKETAHCLVAVRSLPRGTILTEADFRRAALESVSAAPSDRRRFVTDPAELVGMELVRSVRAGAAIPRDGVAAPRVIRRRQTVLVDAPTGGLIVRLTGIAVSDARLGQTVTIENPVSRRRFQARAIGPGRARLVAAPAREPARGTIPSNASKEGRQP